MRAFSVTAKEESCSSLSPSFFWLSLASDVGKGAAFFNFQLQERHILAVQFSALYKL